MTIEHDKLIEAIKKLEAAEKHYGLGSGHRSAYGQELVNQCKKDYNHLFCDKCEKLDLWNHYCNHFKKKLPCNHTIHGSDLPLKLDHCPFNNFQAALEVPGALSGLWLKVGEYCKVYCVADKREIPGFSCDSNDFFVCANSNGISSYSSDVISLWKELPIIRSTDRNCVNQQVVIPKAQFLFSRDVLAIPQVSQSIYSETEAKEYCESNQYTFLTWPVGEIFTFIDGVLD